MVTLVAPNGQIGDIPDEQVDKAVAAGFKRAVPMIAPTGHRGHVPEDRVEEARKQGFVRTDLPAPIAQGLQGPLAPSTETPAREGMIPRYLRQSGISGLWNLIAGDNASDIPKSGPERRAAQNAKINAAIDSIVGPIRQGKYGEAGNKAGELVGGMIPGVSQAGDVIKDIAQGEYGNILPDVAGGATQLLGLKAGEGALQAPRSARIQRALGLVPGTDADFIKTTQPAIASYGNTVGNKLKYLDDARKAIPLMQEQDPKIKVDLTSNKLTAPKVEGPLPPTKDTFIPANENAIAKIDSQFDPMVARARTFGVTGNGGAVTQSVIDSIPEKMRLLNPSGYQRLMDAYTDAYGTLKNPKFFSPEKLIDLRATTNAQLAKFYEGLSGQIDDTLAYDANKSSLDAEAKALRNEIYTKIDPEHNGEWAAELMDRRGALQNIRDAHEKLVNKNLGAAQPTVGEKAMGAVGDVAGLTTGLKGVKNVAMERATKPATIESNIEKAFRQKVAPLPGPTGGMSPIYPQNPLQLGPGLPPPADTTAVRVTTGPPLQVTEPAAPLTPPGEGPRPVQTPLPETIHELKSNPKYSWYEEAEQRPGLELERTPNVPDVFQRLLHEGEQPEGPALGQPAGPPPPMQSSTPTQKPMNFNDIIDILRRGGF